MLREMQEIQALATKYSKADLGRMVQMGMLDPQKAMMAGMMIERIQQQNSQPPKTTVAQDVLGMPPVANQPPAPPQGGPQGAPQGMPPQASPQAAPQGAPQGMAEGGGVESLPAGDVGNYADGGIVAFAGGGVPEKSKYDEMIRNAAEKAGVDPAIFRRLIFTESSFNPSAVSYGGRDAGLGIAQLSKHHKLTEAQRLDPKFSLGYAANYLKGLVDKTGGDYRRALEKYKGVVTDKGRRRMGKAIATVLGEEYVPQPSTRMASAAPKDKKQNRKIDRIDNPFAVRDEDLVPRDRFQYAHSSQQPEEGIAGLGDVNQLAMLSTPYVQQQGGDTGEYEMLEEPTGGFAGGGIIALAQGGVPGYAGNEGSFIVNPTYGGKKWEDLPPAKNKLAGSIGDVFSNFGSSLSQGTLRADPLTGEPITLGEFLRRADQERTTKAKKDLPAINSAPVAGKAPALQGTQKDWSDKAEEGKKTGSAPAAEPKEEAAPKKAMSLQDEMAQYNPRLPTMPRTTPQSTEEIGKATDEAYARRGYDPEVFNKMISKIEEKKGSEATDRDRAIGESIMMAGFKLMGARKGQEFQNLSEGAQEGLKSYQTSMEKLRERREKYDARIEALQAADMQARKTGAEADITERRRQEEAARQEGIAVYKAETDAATMGAKVYADIYGSDQHLRGVLAGAGANREYANAIRLQALEDKKIQFITERMAKVMEMLKKDPLNIGVADSILEARARAIATRDYEAAVRIAAGGGAPAQSAPPAGGAAPQGGLNQFYKN